MIALLQRVLEARVMVAGAEVGAIGPGLLAFIGVRPEDGADNPRRLVERLLSYRVFADGAGRMNRSLADTAGGLLLVPQFTLAADTTKGTRPSFSSAAPPEQASALFEAAVAHAMSRHERVATGRFGADMVVHLINDGPVTFWLDA
ncbi:MAG: D-aminoacyl-tRNA deacylase [Rhodocyclaceae bacterium]|nr:D-aminoacyl-tRNA deacylase [Rhodocyclaceae bacterium]